MENLSRDHLKLLLEERGHKHVEEDLQHDDIYNESEAPENESVIGTGYGRLVNGDILLMSQVTLEVHGLRTLKALIENRWSRLILVLFEKAGKPASHNVHTPFLMLWNSLSLTIFPGGRSIWPTGWENIQTRRVPRHHSRYFSSPY